jgi:dipeptidyl aminopeptidase/acylaminoacyl peptidase
MTRPGAAGKAAVSAAALVLLLGCSGVDPEPPAQPEAAPTTEPSEETTAAEGGGEREPAAKDALPRVEDRLSLPRLMREQVRAGRIRRTQRLGGTDRWTGWAVTYTVAGATVSGELLVPTGRGPFPALVLNHGYIEPSVYELGQGMSREQEWFAANGFVVLHTDYRGHAGSDPVGELERESRLAYTRDAIGAVRALEQERYVDEDRLGMVGRSMGGGVTYNALVAQPDLVDAAVVFAPVSSDFVDNLERWTLPERPDQARLLAERLGGTPQQRPRPYRQLSARTYFDRIEAPVLIHHGTSDDICPIEWSRETHRLLRAAGVASRLTVHDGEEHAFGPQFPRAMQATVAFLRRHLR